MTTDRTASSGAIHTASDIWTYSCGPRQWKASQHSWKEDAHHFAATGCRLAVEYWFPEWVRPRQILIGHLQLSPRGSRQVGGQHEPPAGANRHRAIRTTTRKHGAVAQAANNQVK